MNRELVLLYCWDIVGAGLWKSRKSRGWGESVVERLASDLRAEFPDMQGFSVFNVWRMRQIYLEYTGVEFLAQAVPELRKLKILAQPVPEIVSSGPKPILEQAAPEGLTHAVRELAAMVPWGHHVELLKKVKEPAARLYYLRATAQCGWSRSVLLNQIKAQAYERAVKEKKTHNFELALPEHLAEQADEMLKSRYSPSSPASRGR